MNTNDFPLEVEFCDSGGHLAIEYIGGNEFKIELDVSGFFFRVIFDDLEITKYGIKLMRNKIDEE